MIGTASNSSGNSIIYLKKSTTFSDDRQPYSVEQIIREQGGAVKLHLRPFIQASCQDPYVYFPLFRAKIWRQNLEDATKTVDISEFRCHGALWKFNETECVIVMTDRVSVYISFY